MSLRHQRHLSDRILKVAVFFALLFGSWNPVVPPAVAQTPMQYAPTTQPGPPVLSISPRINRMIQEYYQLQSRSQSLQQTYSENHPELRLVRARLKLIDRQLRQTMTDRVLQAYQIANANRQRLTDFQHQICSKTGRVDVSLEGLEASLRSLEEQKQSLIIEQAGEEARRQTIEQIISEESKKMLEAKTDDPVKQELTALEDIRQKQVDIVSKKHEAGAAVEAEVINAQAALTEVKLKLAERKNALATSSSADVVGGLNAKLIDSTVAEKQRQAMLKEITSQLERLGSVTDIKLQMADCERHVKDAQGEVQQAESDAWEVERAIDLSKPMDDAAEPATTQGSGK
jgi:cytochrome c556